MKKMSEVSSYDRTRAGQPLRHTICSQRPQLTFLWMLHKITATETSQRHLSYGTRQPRIFFHSKDTPAERGPQPQTIVALAHTNLIEEDSYKHPTRKTWSLK